jgi:hypothetical protein
MMYYMITEVGVYTWEKMIIISMISMVMTMIIFVWEKSFILIRSYSLVLLYHLMCNHHHRRRCHVGDM